MAEKRKVLIIGSGPAAYTAAIYAGRAELAPVEIAGEQWGGQLMNTTVVENWPGYEVGVMGPELMDQMKKQAVKFGTEMVNKYVTAVDFGSRPFKLWTKTPEGVSGVELMTRSNAEEYAQAMKKIKILEHDFEAEAVIVATGAVPIFLGIEGESRLLGRGVATCAVCDAAFYREKVAGVVGGGDAAIEDTLALTKFAKKVYLIVRRDELRASKIMGRRVMEHEKVEILWNTEVLEVAGENKLEKVKLIDNKTSQERELELDGLFYAIGHRPVTKFLKDQVALDGQGYLVTRLGYSGAGVEMAKSAIGENGLVGFPTTTSVEGVFGAGDVVDFRYRQAITAAAMGCQAALDAERWLESVEGNE